MPGKYIKWNTQDIVNAISYHQAGASIREAGRKYGVPRSTLTRYLQNKPLKKKGPEPL